MRSVLEDLGPVFASLGRYLSSRVDLLPAGCCEELAGIADWGTPAPWHDVRATVQRDLASGLEDVFPQFEREPFECRLLFQQHRARLADGTAVNVRIVRREIRRHMDDLDHAPYVLTALGGSALAGVSEDFTSVFPRRLDLAQELRTLRALAPATQNGETTTDTFLVPAVYPDCSGKDLLTTGLLPGVTLASLLRGGEQMPRAGFAPRLCVAWLNQVLTADFFAAELWPEDVVLAPGRRFALSGGMVEGAPEESRENLRKYLIAVAADDADTACECLLAQIAAGDRLNSVELRQRFRQAVPFRDGAWGKGRNGVAETALVHWRLLTERGLVLRPYLTAFFRGLFAVADAARRLGPDSDPLFDALRDVRLAAGFARLGALTDRRQLEDQMESMSSIMLSMPQWMDSLLASGPDGMRIKVQLPDGDGSGRRGNAYAAIAAVAVLMAAFALFGQQIMPALVGAVWAERINAVVFLLMGALLLRIASYI
jgi:ubiquinone biosynthesis protein